MGGQGKQYLLLRGEPLLAHTLRAFQDCSVIQQIVLVTKKEDLERCQQLVEEYRFDKVCQVAEGGAERQDSVYNGLKFLPGGTRIVAVHDGARPLITPEIVERSIAKLEDWDGLVVGVPAKDTLKQVEGERIIETLPRQQIWYIQTPQVFVANLLVQAYEKAEQDNYRGTDDAVLMERLGYSIRIVEGSYENIKITTLEDLAAAEAILARRSQ